MKKEQPKPCPGSAGGHPHGHVYYRRRKDRVAICNYCNEPVVAQPNSDHRNEGEKT